jgi:hypothetical protein
LEDLDLLSLKLLLRLVEPGPIFIFLPQCRLRSVTDGRGIGDAGDILRSVHSPSIVIVHTVGGRIAAGSLFTLAERPSQFKSLVNVSVLGGVFDMICAQQEADTLLETTLQCLSLRLLRTHDRSISRPVLRRVAAAHSIYWLRLQSCWFYREKIE